MLFHSLLYGEGSKQLNIGCTGNQSTNLYLCNNFTTQCYTTNGYRRQFATYEGALNTNSCGTEERLYFVVEANEVVYMGFNGSPSNGEHIVYRIQYEDNLGNTVIVKPEANLPVDPTGPTPPDEGYINDLQEACEGPSELIIAPATGGYNAILWTPPQAGLYFIEFSEKNSSNNYDFNLFEIDLFDITIYNNTSSQVKPGRLYSKSWQFSESSEFTGINYILSDDGIVTSIEFDGMNGGAWVQYANQTGCGSSNWLVSRKSLDNAQAFFPQYKVFLNPPDANHFYIATTAGTLIEPMPYGNRDCDGHIDFIVNVDKEGDVDIELTFTPATYTSVTIHGTVTPGENSIYWNGSDGSGIPVPNDVGILFTVSYYNGLTNLPLYDVEGNSSGFQVHLYAPVGSGEPYIYWDDTNLPNNGSDVQENIATGCLSPYTFPACHKWSSSWGNLHTVNSWWYSVSTSQTRPPINQWRGPQTLIFNQSLPQTYCEGIENVTYSVIADPNTTDYYWNFTGTGAVITHTNPSDPFITVNFSEATTGNITVYGTNSNCGDPSTTVTLPVTINPIPTVDPVSNQVVCKNSGTAAIDFTGSSAGATYNWVNTNINIGLPASGVGDIASFTATNAGTTPISATITVTPSYTDGITCTGTPTSFTITVNPSGDVNDPADLVLCHNAPTGDIAFTTGNTGGTTTYEWVNNDPSIGLPALGSGNITTFAAQNPGLAPVTATITVTPTFTNLGVSCTGTAQAFTITVNPAADVNDPADLLLCHNAPTGDIAFTTDNTGGTTTYDWVNSDPSIGLAAMGSGNITSFAAQNPGLAPVTATITVTPTFTNLGISCTGTTQTFTITVNPAGDVNDPADLTLCHNATTGDIDFTTDNTGGTTTYDWVNSDPSIGLAALGSGNITSFSAQNPGLSPVTATITVTPTFTSNGVSCTGTAQTFTITVNPAGDVNVPADVLLCHNATTGNIDFTTDNTGGTTTYDWVNNDPSIGLAALGSGNITSFTAHNPGLAPVTATITVTPTFTNNGVSCIGTAQSFTITVNPSGDVNDPADVVLCHNATTGNIDFTTDNTGGTTTYDWVNSDPSIGLAAMGSGNIPSFTVDNPGLAPVTATITVTPTFTNGGVSCDGTPQTFTITVNPAGDVNDPGDLTLCHNAQTGNIDFTTGNTGGTTTYEWVNNDPSIGLPALGSGNITTFAAQNPGLAPVTATVTVTPTFTNLGVSCTGAPQTFTITVNPSGDVNDPGDVVLCHNATTGDIVFNSDNSGGTTTYDWVNNETSIGLGAMGSGSIPSFTATNFTNAPVVANITVTPTFTNGGVSCTGTAQLFTITVNPKPAVIFPASPPNPQEICSGTQATPVPLSSSVTVPGVTYAWTAQAFDPVNPTALITGFTTPSPANPAAIPADNITSMLLTQGVVKYTVTPFFNSPGLACPGDPAEYQTLVNPSPSVALDPPDPTGQTICSGQSSAPVTFTPNATPVIYTWEAVETINLVSAIPSGSTDNIPSQTLTLTGLLQGHVKYKVTPSYQGGGSFVCPGGASYSTIFVNPLPTPAISGPTLTCELGPEVTYSTPHVDGNAYTWSVTGGTIASGQGTHQIAVQWGSYTASPGTITLTETIATTGCFVTTPVYQVTLQQRPIPTLTGPTEVCTGSTLNLYTSDAGNFSYIWTISGGTFTAGGTPASPSATVTWDTPGDNWIEVNYQNALGCPGFPAKRVNVLVNPLPVTTITPGTGPDCNGQQHAYQTPLDPPCTYTWSASNGNVVSGQGSNNASINWLAAGPATVFVTGTYIGTTNCTSSSSLPVTVYPSPEPSLTACYDRVTTQNAKPIELKGGLPVGGEYQGSPAITHDITTGKYWFNPASPLVTTGDHDITYRSQNSYGCANTSSPVAITLLPSNASFTCNSTFTDPRDGKSYPTVMLGSQCWFKTNLRYSAPSPYTATPLSTPQSDNCTFERYCLDTDPTCTSFGGFYQWNELMQYNDDLAATSQGFCPPGWHVPSATEWQNMIDASQGPGIAGGELKDLSATQSFQAILGGIGYLNNIWAFSSPGTPAASLFWTSTLNAGKPVTRGLNSFNPSVSIYESSPANAFPVRCVKDN